MFYGLMVTKDEENRYLQSCLQWAFTFLDSVFVYDDLSLDGTATIAAREGAIVEYRDANDPTFLDNEGVFRNNSWLAFEERVRPDENDWVLALDADDFFVGSCRPGGLQNYQRLAMEEYASHAEYVGRDSVALTFHQVWKNELGIWTRQDGYWPKDKRPQLFRYRRGGTMIRDPKKKLATGCWPTYADHEPLTTVSYGGMLHYGYARDEDKKAKYDRYSSHKGHGGEHIESILKPAKLAEWRGEIPKVWTGVR